MRRIKTLRGEFAPKGQCFVSAGGDCFHIDRKCKALRRGQEKAARQRGDCAPSPVQLVTIVDAIDQRRRTFCSVCCDPKRVIELYEAGTVLPS